MSRTSVLAKATRAEPRSEDRDAISELRQLTSADPASLTLRRADGQEVAVPENVMRILLATVQELLAGHAVMLLPMEIRLTPAEVGELLGLSRPFVSRLLDQGSIPFERLPGSSHRVVRMEDVIEFQERRERHREGRRRIVEVIESEDLPY